MNRKFAGALAIALTLAGCGGGSGPSRAAFKRDFAASQKQFRQLGTTIVSEIRGAGAKTDATLASDFHALAAQARRQASALLTLKSPAQYKRNVATMVTGFHALGGDLSKIAGAATKHDPTTARAATNAMLADAAKIKSADSSVSKSLGLPTR
jgi:hypothetical protein